MFAESSYFNFLMEHRCTRRTRVPFAQVAGVIPELTGAARLRRPQRRPEASLDGIGRRRCGKPDR
jgi:hypothetical protein